MLQSSDEDRIVMGEASLAYGEDSLADGESSLPGCQQLKEFISLIITFN